MTRTAGNYDVTTLEKERERLALALECGRQALFEWWPQDDVLELSPSWYTLYRRPPGSVQNALVDFLSLIHPDDRAAVLDATTNGLNGDVPFMAQYRLFRGDGTSAWVMARGVVTERDAEGRATRMLGSHVDITELKTVEERLRLAVDSTAQGIIEWWPQEDRLQPTASWIRLTGYAAGEVASTSQIRQAGLVHPDDATTFAEFLRTLADGHAGSSRIEARFRLRDGAYRWLLGSGMVAETDAAGRALRVVGTFIDIDGLKTEFHAAEAERARLSLIIQGTDAAVWEWDMDSGETTVNERWAQHLGYASQAEFGPTSLARWRERVHPDDLERVEAILARCVQGDEPAYACEYRLRHRDGRWVWVHDSGQVVARARNGRPQRMAGVYLDVTMRVERDRHLKAIAEAVTQVRGGDLLSTVVRTARELADASHAFVAALDDEGAYATVVAAAPADTCLAGVRLAVTGTPAADTIAHAWSVHARDVRALYPQDALLRDLGAEAYAGQRLDGEEACAGLFVLLFHRPVTDLGRVRSVLEILAATATHELERERRAAALRDSEQRYRRIYQTMPVMLCTLDGEGTISDVNEAWVQATGYALRECTGRSVAHFFAPSARDAFARLLAAGGNGPERVHLQLMTRRGRLLTVACAVFGSGLIGSADVAILALEDVTEKIKAEREIERLAFHDSLTGLPNRRYLLDRLGPAIAAVRRRNARGALLFIDLDHFKQINDSMGHAVGDAVLVQVGNRLRELIRQEDVVSRLGGDEFIVMLADLGPDHADGRGKAETVAQKIALELSRPYAVDQQSFHITPTIGIALFPDQSDDADELLKAADAAMYKGKMAGRNTWRVFHASMAEAAGERVRLETELRAALAGDQFELYFQPQIDAERGVVGAEALLRWHHPQRGLVPPDHFVPVAEESSLIEAIDAWVIERALALLSDWLATDPDFIDHLSVNVSSRYFRTPGFVPSLIAARERAGVPAGHVILELTERIVIDDVEGTSDKMAELRRLGFRFSIDDFGIGYSSLAYLRRLPLDQLKVDRFFVRDVVEDANAGVIAETILSLGRQLGLETIAEGVETEAQYRFLVEHGTRGFQGNLFCPAVPAADFLAFCASYRRS